MIPYGRQDINQQDIDAVIAVLQSDWLTQGPQSEAFEQAVAHNTKARFAIATNSATSALHIACLALNVKAGDHVWTSPISFVASANCALYCGASIDFVDVDPLTGNMCPSALEQKLALAQKQGNLPKVVIPVHLCGHSCDMAAIYQLSQQYHFHIIEDASHGIGGEYQGYKLGQCQFADITVFSFHPVKIITTAEGGIATTNQTKLAEKLTMYRSHGITRHTKKLTRPTEGGWYYEQQLLGFNYRMTDLQAALGLSQLTQLDTFVARRNDLAKIYQQKLAKLPVDTVEPIDNSVSARHLQMIRLNNHHQRKQLFDGLRAKGIQAHVHYFPIYLQPYYQDLGFTTGYCPNAENFYRRILTLPLFPKMADDDVSHIVAVLTELMKT